MSDGVYFVKHNANEIGGGMVARRVPLRNGTLKRPSHVVY